MAKSWKTLIDVKWRFPLPRIVIHENYQAIARWISRGLMAAGVATSLLTMPIPWAFAVACILTIVQVVVEKFIFYYTSLYVQPMPDFEYDPTKWVSMAYGFVESSGVRSGRVGIVFTDIDYAASFFKRLRSWNYSNDRDYDNNIRLTFVTLDECYYVYIYPNPSRTSVTDAFDKAEAEQAISKHGKEHFGLVVQVMFCKTFDYSTGYSLADFDRAQLSLPAFSLVAYLQENTGSVSPIESINPIAKKDYKLKHYYELDDSDIETEHFRQIVLKSG